MKSHFICKVLSGEKYLYKAYHFIPYAERVFDDRNAECCVANVIYYLRYDSSKDWTAKEICFYLGMPMSVLLGYIVKYSAICKDGKILKI